MLLQVQKYVNLYLLLLIFVNLKNAQQHATFSQATGRFSLFGNLKTHKAASKHTYTGTENPGYWIMCRFVIITQLDRVVGWATERLALVKNCCSLVKSPK